MKYINNIKTLFCGTLLLLSAGASLTSCTEWLDKEADSIVSDNEAFKNFRNFQGYIEEIYNKIPDKEKVNYCTAWNFGDDAVHNPYGFAHMDHQVDLGNYRDWYTNSQCWLNGSSYSLWNSSWYCIRKCNLGIENIKELVGTDEERDLLLGQMYFFRAWWHFELMCYFGGLPYIDEAFKGEIPNLPRLSFQECADRCAEDFERAADLLPIDWDETLAGMQTAGNNMLRINKIMALCYLGKVYLWAGSPLMKEFEKTKNGGIAQLTGASQNGKTYDYDAEYCRKAAEVLGQVLNMVDNGQTPYELSAFNYSNIYDHDHDEDDRAENCYSDNFYTVGSSWEMPGAKEAIFRGISSGGDGSNWNCSKLFGPKVAGLVDHDQIIHHPTANLIDQYGMANGQPIYLVRNGQLVENPESGWDKEHPYKDRDPRFYHDIVFDGFHYVLNTEKLNDQQKAYEYCDLSTGGAMRDPDLGSSTGYFIQKLVPHQCNQGDRFYFAWQDYNIRLHCYLSYMRLAEIYLMYAEAVAATDGPNGRASTCFLTAVDAINVLRDRVNSSDYPMARVPKNLMDTKEHFMDEIRRERAVELAFEGHRWCDLQRWLLLTEAPYTLKYSHEFKRVENAKWYINNDPKDARVLDFERKDLITRELEERHYWFPFPDKEVYLYPEFKQNPGW